MKALTLFTSLLALSVILLGAYTRLNDAGLGCPDWPGCYGHLVLPNSHEQLLQASIQYQQPVEKGKAWTEMTHRYLAGSLGLCIFVLSIWGCIRKIKKKQIPVLPILLMGLLVFQALLGMWTVTLLLKPIIVMLHLLGGLTILSLLWWQYLGLKIPKRNPHPGQFKSWALIGLLLLFTQIALGGWTSANYAALICPDFPYCQGKFLPTMSFSHFFSDKSQLGLITIHMTHRFGALIVGSFLSIFSVILWRKGANKTVRHLGLVLLILLSIQITFGIFNIIKFLPMPIAVGHNLVAALLLIMMLTINFRLREGKLS